MEYITRKAYAKINLGLDVLGKKADGYHEVRMIMQTVGIYDVLQLKKRTDSQIVISATLSGAKAEELPCDDHNLIYRAAVKVMEHCGLAAGMDVALQKNIPIAAGMAGGSTDAAAMILAMNELYRLEMNMEEMKELAVQIGADVPYCLIGGTALSEGIGEILTVLPPAPACMLLVVKPDVSVSTAFVYGHLDAAGLTWHPDIDGLMTALAEKNVPAVAQHLGNVLETVTVPEYPVINELKNAMLADGALNALMSGSGPTVFGIFDSEQKRQAAYDHLRLHPAVSQIFMTGMISEI